MQKPIKNSRTVLGVLFVLILLIGAPHSNGTSAISLPSAQLTASSRPAEIDLRLNPISAIQSGDFWQKKDYHQWSEAECRKLLEDSPWALKYAMDDNGHNTAAGSISPYNPQAPLLGTQYQAQFRSALPIRQAIVKLAQIKRKYDKMTPEQKKTFDEQTDSLINANFQDRTVLYFIYGSNSNPIDKELSNYWKKQTTDTLKNSVYLINQRNEKISLLNYAVNTGDAHEFEFDFPRDQGGKPVILPDDKAVRLEFVHPAVNQRQTIPLVLEFKPSKMVMAGSLIY